MTAVLYIEGGGDNRRLGAQFREGWTSFFTAAGLRGRMPRVVRGGTRQDTFSRFATDAAGQKPGTIPLLLVDSEDPVAAGHSAWQHLQQQDGWDIPAGAGEDQAFLMVQVMETWFLADREALRSYFGPLFVENALRQWPRLEDLSRETVLAALDRATAQCPNPYSKGKTSFGLLARIDPTLVEAACPHGKDLLNRLRGF